MLRLSQSLINIPTPCAIVGDINGNFHDLIRIFVTIPDALMKRILFQGDDSFDVVVLLFALFLLYPGQIFLLRGNHEFPAVNETDGFRTEIMEQFGDDALWRQIDLIFHHMPLGALVGETCLCLHGGIGPGIATLDDLRSIQLPLATDDDANVAAILWSDPCKNTAMFGPSQHRLGVVFGQVAVSQFLSANELMHLIRAHQCVQYGISLFEQKKCITIFSSSNSPNQNSTVFVEIKESNSITNIHLRRLKL
jgi:hypothetical protein